MGLSLVMFLASSSDTVRNSDHTALCIVPGVAEFLESEGESREFVFWNGLV